MALTTVNKLSAIAESAIRDLIKADGCDWFELLVYQGKICIHDIDDDIYYTLKDGLEEISDCLDYAIGHYVDNGDITEEQYDALMSICDFLHVNMYDY